MNKTNERFSKRLHLLEEIVSIGTKDAYCCHSKYMVGAVGYWVDRNIDGNGSMDGEFKILRFAYGDKIPKGFKIPHEFHIKGLTCFADVLTKPINCLSISKGEVHEEESIQPAA